MLLEFLQQLRKKMIKEKNHRWNTRHFEDYTSFLDRTELNRLYPSESWCLYRTIVSSKNVLDLGCGNGAMSSITKKINKKTKYLVIDHQSNLIEKAKIRFVHSKFVSSDLTTFLKNNSKKFELVMAWSVIKSFKNWKFILKKMVESSKKYIVFDQRVANLKSTNFDTKILAANYGGIKGPLLCINYKNLKREILKHKRKFLKVEFMAYQSEWGKNIFFKYKNKVDTFVVTVVITLKKNKRDKFLGIYEQTPLNLKK